MLSIIIDTVEPKEDETPEGKALAEFFHFHFHHHWANQQQNEGIYD